MASLFGVNFDPTPGFSLGISDAGKKVSKAGNSFQGSTQQSPQFSNPTGASTSGSPFGSFFDQVKQGIGTKPTKADSSYPGQVQSDMTGTGGIDKYAKYGGESGYNSLLSGFDTQKQNIYGTARDAASNAFNTMKGGILDMVQGLRSGQRALDERGVQNELGLRQGRSSILDMVGQGIRSGGTMLANRNAGDSSAVEGIARAYGRMGQQQLGKIGNQYELENRDIGLAQDEFNQGRQTSMRKFDETKMQTVNNIVTQARNSLAALDAEIAAADLPNRIQLEQEKERIKQEAIGILSGLDQELSQGVSSINPAGMDANRRTAADLATRGVAAANPFDFTAEVPAQFQNGPFSTELPLFFNRPRRQEV